MHERVKYLDFFQKIAEAQIFYRVCGRLDIGMLPIINEEGNLNFPY
jgi:hypothetical protein